MVNNDRDFQLKKIGGLDYYTIILQCSVLFDPIRSIAPFSLNQ